MSRFLNSRLAGIRVRWRKWLAIAAVGVLVPQVPALARVPERLLAGCPGWVTFAIVLELLSMLGFVLVFKLVFGAQLSWRQGWRAGLRALGATTVLPGGGLVGPAVGARAAGVDRAPASVVRATIAFTLITSAPSVIVLGALAAGLWLGWPAGPHSVFLTLPVAVAAICVLAVAWLTGGAHSHRSSNRQLRHAPVRYLFAGISVLRGGTQDARRLLAAGNWKLLGAVGYYAFDNAVLWAAFRAEGHAPALSVIVMGYLVGSLAAAVPIPAGLGALEGGLIGALVLYGAPAAPAVTAVLIYRAVSFSLPVLSGAFAWAPWGQPLRGRLSAAAGASKGRRLLRSTAPAAPRHRAPSGPADRSVACGATAGAGAGARR
jgi:uncharacterized membrane protein YbhN (UPF0104 family)